MFYLDGSLLLGSSKTTGKQLTDNAVCVTLWCKLAQNIYFFVFYRAGTPYTGSLLASLKKVKERRYLHCDMRATLRLVRSGPVAS